MVRVVGIDYSVDKPGRGYITAWIARLLDRAYGESQRNKRIKVLINPFGGQGKAQKWYTRDVEPIFMAARCMVDVERTKFQGHAVEIAEQLDTDSYDVIAACSGDGLPHEVFNGLGKRRDARRALSKIAVAQLPCGSGNAMSWSLNGTASTSLAALCIVKGIRTSMDLTSITQGERRTLSFLSQAVGIIAESDLGTEHLRWLGDARFSYGVLIRLMKQTIYPCDLAVKVEIDNKFDIREHHRIQSHTRQLTEDRPRVVGHAESSVSEEGDGLPTLRYGSIVEDLPQGWSMVPYDKLGNFYAGNMAYMAANTPVFQASLPSDGFLDLVTIDGDIGISSGLQSMFAVEKGTFFDLPYVNYRKISGYRIIPKGQKTGYISIDGESYPFAPFQAEVHCGLGTVLSKSGHLYQTKGVSEGVHVDSE